MALPRVLLADDHAIVAEGLRLLLKDHCELVGSVADGPSLGTRRVIVGVHWQASTASAPHRATMTTVVGP